MKYIWSSGLINLCLTKLWLVRAGAGRKIGVRRNDAREILFSNKENVMQGLSTCIVEAANMDIVIGRFLLFLFTH
jgi:hypothetical protein